MTRNRLLLVQTGTPPTAIRQAHGDLPRWFRTLLAPWQTQLTTVRVFEDEPLPTPDNQTIAVLQAEGIDAQRLHDEVQESPQGAAILTRFVSAFLTPDAPGH